MNPAAGAQDPWPAGLFFRSGRSDALLEAPSLKSDVVIRINGEVARTHVRQRFLNPADVWLEGVYVFPLPQGSAVDRLVMEVGERRIEGRILPKKEAEQVFKKAAAEGRKASLLASERPNVFVTTVANIGPGESVTIEIEYQDRALYRDGRFELRFPMVVAPRYTPGSEETPMVSAPQPAPASRPLGTQACRTATTRRAATSSARCASPAARARTSCPWRSTSMPGCRWPRSKAFTTPSPPRR
jgi:hypothetical protein